MPISFEVLTTTRNSKIVDMSFLCSIHVKIPSQLFLILTYLSSIRFNSATIFKTQNFVLVAFPKTIACCFFCFSVSQKEVWRRILSRLIRSKRFRAEWKQKLLETKKIKNLFESVFNFIENNKIQFHNRRLFQTGDNEETLLAI